MQQHPVPQHISSYEFRLVGDMTLKQFFQLAAGALLALLIYASGLPGIIKWPLVLLFSLLGAAFAFLPFEERPLTTWFLSFIKAIYSPTKYTWVRGGAEEVFAGGHEPEAPAALATQGEAKAQEYLSKVPEPAVLSTFEEAEKNVFQRITQLFHSTPIPSSGPAPVQSMPASGQFPVTVTTQETVPVNQPIKIEPLPTRPQAQPAPTSVYQPKPVSPVFQPASPSSPNPAQQATFTPEAAPPNPPGIPNTVTGQVLAPDGKIIEGAILEIQDLEGRPVRALKSNKLGHFLSVTPIQNGSYEIETEKEGFVFGKIAFRAEGGIIPPILIKAEPMARQEAVNQ